jgi:hypothetical protein
MAAAGPAGCPGKSSAYGVALRRPALGEGCGAGVVSSVHLAYLPVDMLHRTAAHLVTDGEACDLDRRPLRLAQGHVVERPP